MSLDNFVNFAKVTVSLGYGSGATSIVLNAGDGAKLASPSFNAVWYDATAYIDPTDDPNREIVRVTNVATDTLTITRAQESTSAVDHNILGHTYKLIAGLTAKTLNNLFVSPTFSGDVLIYDSNTNDFQVKTQNTNSAHAAGFAAYSDTGQAIFLGMTGSAMGGWDANVGIVGTLTNRDLLFITNNIERMRITAAGTITGQLAAPEGFLINGKIVPSVASNNLTVAIKGMDGNDPSAINPVYVRIGSVIRSITAALSCTLNAGANKGNAGSVELATQEIDWFTYLGVNAGNGNVYITTSRYPAGNLQSDFTGTGTGEKDLYPVGTFAGTDVVVNIGRFAATLSAGAGYTWSVPTFTATNLIQRPIYETRWLTYLPTYASDGSMTYTASGVYKVAYMIRGDECHLQVSVSGTTGGSASQAITYTLPFSNSLSSAYTLSGGCGMYDGSFLSGLFHNFNATTIGVIKTGGANWGVGASKDIYTQMIYQI